MPAFRAEIQDDRHGVDAIADRARELGVLGWVRHDDDGVLRVHAESDEAALQALVAFLGEGAGEVDLQSAKVEGHEQFHVRGVPAGPFVVDEHEGRFALRLEVGGAMRTWTLAKAPSMDPSIKRMAIEVAEEPPRGEVWDEGSYEQGGRVPWPEAIDRGHAVFVLHGEKLEGGFALQRTRPKMWLLIKRRDAAATGAGRRA